MRRPLLAGEGRGEPRQQEQMAERRYRRGCGGGAQPKGQQKQQCCDDMQHAAALACGGGVPSHCRCALAPIQSLGVSLQAMEHELTEEFIMEKIRAGSSIGARPPVCGPPVCLRPSGLRPLVCSVCPTGSRGAA